MKKTAAVILSALSVTVLLSGCAVKTDEIPDDEKTDRQEEHGDEKDEKDEKDDKGSESEQTGHTDHIWNGGEVLTESTCKTAGKKIYTCTVCEATRTESLPLENCDFVTYIPPTCVSEGYKNCKRCSVCGYIEKDGTPIAPKGHKCTEWTVTENATEEKAGLETCVCDTCKETVFRTIPKIGSSDAPCTDVYVSLNRNHTASDKNTKYGKCSVNVIDRQSERPAKVEHTGYLELTVTFIDNKDYEQKIVLSYSGDGDMDEYILHGLLIYEDGSFAYENGRRHWSSDVSGKQ